MAENKAEAAQKPWTPQAAPATREVREKRETTSEQLEARLGTDAVVEALEGSVWDAQDVLGSQKRQVQCKGLLKAKGMSRSNLLKLTPQAPGASDIMK